MIIKLSEPSEEGKKININTAVWFEPSRGKVTLLTHMINNVKRTSTMCLNPPVEGQRS